jgi:hypothetical protein
MGSYQSKTPDPLHSATREADSADPADDSNDYKISPPEAG